MNYKNVNDYEVIYMIRENDDYAESVMYNKYRPLVHKLANKYYLSFDGNINFEDLIQEGMIGVSNAIRTYNENSDVLFYTYISVCVERRLLTYCRNYNSSKHYVLNNSYLDEDIENKSSEYCGCLDSIIETEDFINLKHKFSFIDSNIFELKYNGFTNNEIAQLLDISYGYLMYRLYKIRGILKKRKKLFI